MTTFLNATRKSEGSLLNENTASQVVNAADTYLNGSQIAPVSIPARTHFKWRIVATKTAAGVAPFAVKLRIGALGTIADAVRVLLTSPTAQTAAIDTCCIDIYAILRTLGADDQAAIISGNMRLTHDLAAAGFADRATPSVHVTGAAFDLSQFGKPFVGLSVDPGAAGVWTVEQCTAEMLLT